MVALYDLESIPMGDEELSFRLEIHSDGASFFARLFRYEFYRLQPSFPQKNGEPDAALLADEVVLVRDETFGPLLEELRDASEEGILRQVTALFAQKFSFGKSLE